MQAQFPSDEQQLLPVVDRDFIITLPSMISPPPATFLADCPRGLEPLLGLNAIIIRRRMNQYSVEDSAGQAILHSVHESNCCARLWCGVYRNYAMSFKDFSGMEMIRMKKTSSCIQKLQIHSPDGTLIGTVKQDCTLIRPKFSIENSAGDTVLYIEGPIITTTFGKNKEFKVMSTDKEGPVGFITKRRECCCPIKVCIERVMFASFPVDLDVRMKALLLGACVLIENAYYDFRGMLGSRLNCHRLLVVIFFLFCTLIYIIGKVRRIQEGNSLWKNEMHLDSANIMGEGNR